MIGMGSKKLLNESTSNLPQMGEVIKSWMLPMFLFVVTKVQKGYETVESFEQFDFKGTWQAMSARQIMMKPEGQRNWPWKTCHSTTSLPSKLDDVIMKNDVKFRILGVYEWPEYGYFEYHLVEDWIVAGVTP